MTRVTSGPDRAAVVVVLTKQPRPGRSKTRLQTRFTPAQAAELAAACLEDTLTAVRSCTVPRRVLAWEGDPHGFHAGFEVAPQPPGRPRPIRQNQPNPPKPSSSGRNS